jgi:replicative DNA helicase
MPVASTSQRKTNAANRVNLKELGLGKLPPQALELEEAVLGALMLEKEALTTVIDVLRVDSFYKDAHQRIYAAITTLFAVSEPIDLLTVSNQLRVTGELELVGGLIYLTELTEQVNSSANIEYHARIVAEMAIKRQIITLCSEVSTEAFEDTTDAFKLLDGLEQSLFQLSDSNIRKNYLDMSAIMRQALDELEIKKNQEDGLTGVASGFSKLDAITGGWQKTELIILAARPGMGKTAFVVSAMRNAAVDFNKGIAFFSLEMSAVQLVNRMISAEAEIESDKIRKGQMTNAEWNQLHSKIGKLTKAPIFIDDTPGLSILELRAKCRRLKAQHDIQMIIIDYLQLMTGETGGKGGIGNREQEIASISRALKNLAKELDVPVIALAQLSRAVETRGGDKKPLLSDLRESGSIEQDADMVLFLYRPDYYKITEDEAGNSLIGVGEVIIAKNRSGSLETVPLRFIGQFTKYTDFEGEFMDSASGMSSYNSSDNFNNDFGGGTLKSRIRDNGSESDITPTPPLPMPGFDDGEEPF